MALIGLVALGSLVGGYITKSVVNYFSENDSKQIPEPNNIVLNSEVIDEPKNDNSLIILSITAIALLCFIVLYLIIRGYSKFLKKRYTPRADV